MHTREISVRISHYTLTKRGKAALFSINSFSEDSLDWDDKFLSDKSLEEILILYTDKVKTYAINFDDVFSYRIVVRDEDCRLVKIFNA